MGTPTHTSPAADGEPHVPPRGRGTKLATTIADRIVADVAALEWQEGVVVGSEPELLERYAVSRAVLREAVRLVEHQQVARMRRGPGGGLVVTAPTLESVIEAVAVYLFHEHTRVEQIAEARIALEETVAELAPGRLTEADIAALRELADRERDGTVSDPRELHALLASITKNPALEVFINLLNRLTFLYFPDTSGLSKDTKEASVHAHLAIIDAVAAGDEGLTRNRMRAHLEAEAQYLRRRLRSSQRLDASALRAHDDGTKRGERLARQIFVEVSEAGWPVGALLGSEAELMQRYDVSRAVLREAVRLLEHHGIATMRRGPGGGLFVVSPGLESVIGALALFLERRGIGAADLLELRIAVELNVVALAVKSLDDAQAARLREEVAAERSAPVEEIADVGHDLHAVLAGMVGNPVFELLSRVLVELTRMRQDPSPRSMQPLYDDVVRAHEAIVVAVLDRDVELARHRMRRHLQALAAFLH